MARLAITLSSSAGLVFNTEFVAVFQRLSSIPDDVILPVNKYGDIAGQLTIQFIYYYAEVRIPVDEVFETLAKRNAIYTN